MNFISNAWNGNASLDKVFWLYFFVPATFLVLIEIPLFWWVASIVNYFATAAFLMILVKIPWYMWCTISLAKISKRAQNRFWANAATGVVILSFVLNVCFSVIVVEGLSLATT